DAPNSWAFHRILREDANDDAARVQFETNRVRFIGRGRGLADPWALGLGGTLSGDRGDVLDPIGSLRTTLYCKPGDTQEGCFLLGASQDPSELEAMLAAVADASQATLLLEQAASADASTNGLAHSFDEGSLEPAEQFIVHPPHTSNDPLGFNSQAE